MVNVSPHVILFARSSRGKLDRTETGMNHKEHREHKAAWMPLAASSSRCQSVFRPESVWGLSAHSIGEGLHTDSGRNTDGEGERRCVAPPGGWCVLAIESFAVFMVGCASVKGEPAGCTESRDRVAVAGQASLARISYTGR